MAWLKPLRAAPTDPKVARLLAKIAAQRAATTLPSHLAALDDLVEQITARQARLARRQKEAAGHAA